MASLTAHCLVKNEDRFIAYAINSVINFVEQVLVFDTGSTDDTVKIIKNLQNIYPDKIIFEEKGECDKKRHSQLRQEMLERTRTDWFMVLDGDEVWSKKAMQEAVDIMGGSADTECLIAPFNLCVGDIYHTSRRGQYVLNNIKSHATPRFFRKIAGIHWDGEYNYDAVVDAQGIKIFEKDSVIWLKNKFWHLTHLIRSSAGGNEFSSGSARKNKLRLTYFLIGKKINTPVPEVFLTEPLPDYLKPLRFTEALKNFFILLRQKLLKFII